MQAGGCVRKMRALSAFGLLVIDVVEHVVDIDVEGRIKFVRPIDALREDVGGTETAVAVVDEDGVDFWVSIEGYFVRHTSIHVSMYQKKMGFIVAVANEATKLAEKFKKEEK